MSGSAWTGKGGTPIRHMRMERLWSTVKYEELYLKAYSNGREAKSELEAYLPFYNTQRPHQILRYRAPAEVFNGNSPTPREQPTERRWSPGRQLACYAGATVPSRNFTSVPYNWWGSDGVLFIT